MRPVTFGGLAMQWVGSEIARQSRAFCSRTIGQMAVEQSWKLLPDDGYFGRIANPVGLMAAMYESIVSLKMADIDPTSIKADVWEDEIKAREFELMARSYQNFLVQNALLDRADVLKLAIAQMRSGEQELEEHWFLFPACDNHSEMEQTILGQGAWSALERQLFDRLPQEQIRTLPLLESAQTEFHWFRSIGNANQVREVLRRCMAEGVPLDDVEIIVADYDALARCADELASRYFSNAADDGTWSDLPITFSDGLPVSVSRPGRCLTQWWHWIESGFPQQSLVNMLSDGLLTCPGKAEIGGHVAAAMLRPLAIGRGSERYLPVIERQIKSLQGQAPSDSIGRRIELWLYLRKLIRPIVELGQRISNTSGPEAIAAARQFILECSRSSNEMDARAKRALLSQLEVRFRAIEQLNLGSLGNEWIGSLAMETRFSVETPRPGCLHISGLTSGGFSGRTHTYILGLDDATFPGRAVPSSVLLDNERNLISCHLPNGRQRIETKVSDFRLLLKRLTGQVTLAWSCYNVAEDRLQYPSPVVLANFRQNAAEEFADGEQLEQVAKLERAAGLPVSYAPTQSSGALDESELWMHWLSEDGRYGRTQLSCIAQRYHHLIPGLHVDEANGLPRMGSLVGFVPEAGAVLDPCAPEGRAYSASALETLGRCPLAFFFREGLHLFPREEFVQEENTWLDAGQIGTLLHEVFRQFMMGLARENLRPDFQRDLPRLESIIRQQLELARLANPPPNESSFRSQALRIFQTARIFLEHEEPLAHSHSARYFEVSLGLSNDGVSGPLDDPKPVCLVLPGGERMQVIGRIDRVDQLNNGQYLIWDYKTGSSYGYTLRDPFDQGRHVQSLLYACMIEISLRQRIDPQAEVCGFGYFFPSIRSAGERLVWQRDELNRGLSLLQNMCDLVSTGYFVATNLQKDCGFCDYRAICRDVAKVTAISNQLIRNEQLVELKPLREMRLGSK